VCELFDSETAAFFHIAVLTALFIEQNNYFHKKSGITMSNL